MFKIEKSSVALPTMPEVDFFAGFLPPEEAKNYFDLLMAELEFAAETYTFNGQTIETKRKISYHSELAYTYSTQVYAGKAWTPTLNLIKEKIESRTGYSFNAVLVNHYVNGEAGMGWHADKERELGDKPIIASISLGQTRRFAFRHRKELTNVKNPPRLAEYILNSGDLLIMKGDTQKFFEHCVVKDKSATNTRINLTFRKIVT